MQAANPMPMQNPYDPRWFIWTIVFLVVSGVSLVSYIVLSDNGSSDFGPMSMAKAPVHSTHVVAK